MTRSKQEAKLYYSNDEFKNYGDLSKSVSRKPIELAAQDVVRASGQVADDLRTVVQDGRAMVELLRRHDERLADAMRAHQDRLAAGQRSQEPAPQLAPDDAVKLGELRQRREVAAQRLLASDDRATVTRAARHVGLTVTRLEELAGLREPARTPRQRAMDAVARAWVDAHRAARQIWTGIRSAGGAATAHPDYPRFAVARDERDKLALALREQAALARGSVAHVADRAMWSAVTRQAAGAEQRLAAEIRAQTQRTRDAAQAQVAQAQRTALQALDRTLAPLLAPRLAKIGWNLSRAAEAGLGVHHTPDGPRICDARRPEASASLRSLLSYSAPAVQAAKTAPAVAVEAEGQQQTPGRRQKI